MKLQLRNITSVHKIKETKKEWESEIKETSKYVNEEYSFIGCKLYILL